MITHRAIKFGFQRMFRGFDNSDCWAFKWNFIERNYKLIKHFKNNCVNYPCTMTEEEWDNILDRMLHCLYMMDEDKVITYLKIDMPEDWEPATNSVYEIMERYKNEFFDLMKEHFYDLWY